MSEKSLRDFAVGFETKGVTLYLGLAAKAQNLLAKRLFYSLAEQEVQHAYLFDTGYFYQDTGTLASTINDIEQTLKDFWEKMKGIDLKKQDDHISGYEDAMELEKQSISAYHEFLSKSNDEKEKEFLNWIIEEEKKHLEALRNVYYFLTEPGDWFQNEESKIWNWMNQ